VVSPPPCWFFSPPRYQPLPPSQRTFSTNHFLLEDSPDFPVFLLSFLRVSVFRRPEFSPFLCAKVPNSRSIVVLEQGPIGKQGPTTYGQPLSRTLRGFSTRAAPLLHCAVHLRLSFARSPTYFFFPAFSSSVHRAFVQALARLQPKFFCDPRCVGRYGF